MMNLDREELRNWFKDKKIRVWRRAVFLLYHVGKMSNLEIADTLGADRRGVRRTLSKVQMGNPPHVIFKNHKWVITSQGITGVEYGQKNGKYPILVRGR